MKARKSTTPAKALKATAKTRRTPKAANPVPEPLPAPKVVEAPGPGSNLAGVTLTVGAFKKPDGYRPFVKLRLPEGWSYTSLVPHGKVATRAAALQAAEAYRDQIIADDRLPVRPERFTWQPGDIRITPPTDQPPA